MGAKFTFSLEPVLELKRRREQQLQEDLAVAVRLEQQERQQLAVLLERRRACLDEIEARQQDAVLDLPALLQGEAYLEQLDRLIDEQMRRIDEAALAVAQARDRLAVASKETKSIERLRELRLEEHHRFLDRLEEQRLGELAIQRHLQRMREVA